MELNNGARIIAGGPWAHTREFKENKQLRRVVAFFILHLKMHGEGAPCKSADGCCGKFDSFGVSTGDINRLLERTAGQPKFGRQVRA